MKNRVLHAPRCALSALLACLFASSPALAQGASAANLPETRVTANRIPQDPSLLPMGVTVIDAAQIRAAGIADANEAIRWLGGVVTRIDTSFSRNPTLDLRGFGETAASNQVVLVDGVRQNEGDMSGAAINWIPVESIERIEIVRGSGAVLHGEGATAGVINIVTRKGLESPGGSVSAGAGSMGTRQASASLRGGAGAWHHQLVLSALNTDNHRDNFAMRERNALARTTWDDGSVLLTGQVGYQEQAGGLPGGLNLAEFSANPGQTLKPLDRGDTRTTNLLLGAEFPLADWRAALDFGLRQVAIQSDLVSDSYVERAGTDARRVGVKAWRSLQGLGAQQRLLVGLDAERWTQEKSSDSLYGPSETAIEQRSDAIYARHEFDWTAQGLSAHAGVRRTLSERASEGTMVGALDASNTSWEIGASQRLGASTQVYGRIGTSFRLANANEYSCYGGCPGGSINPLMPQTSRDRELGIRQRVSYGNWAARVYRSDLTNEIGLDSSQWNNVNYDPTRRSGLEVEMTGQLAPGLGLGVQAAHRNAEFREGSDTGKRVPLVPRQSLTARLTWQAAPGRQWVVLTQWASSQKVAGDLDNTCTQSIPGYGVTHLRYNHEMDKWTFSAQVDNLLDRSYYDLRTRCNPAQRSIYPQPGRSVLLVARRAF